MRKIFQFRYYGSSNKNNYPKLSNYYGILTQGNIFKDYGVVSKLGIQGKPGIKFYLNNSRHPISIGETGIYELDLENIGRINSIRFDYKDLEYYDQDFLGERLLIDIVYEGAGI